MIEFKVIYKLRASVFKCRTLIFWTTGTHYQSILTCGLDTDNAPCTAVAVYANKINVYSRANIVIQYLPLIRPYTHVLHRQLFNTINVVASSTLIEELVDVGSPRRRMVLLC